MSTSPRPVVFLDFDGVLNSAGSAIGLGLTQQVWCPTACGLVAHLCERIEAEVVISSSWRLERDSVAQLQELLRKMVPARPDLAARVIGFTPIRDSLFIRATEIAAWLDEHGAERPFVVLDDDTPRKGNPGSTLERVASRWVLVDAETGFSYRHYQQALALFGYEAEEVCL